MGRVRDCPPFRGGENESIGSQDKGRGLTAPFLLASCFYALRLPSRREE